MKMGGYARRACFSYQLPVYQPIRGKMKSYARAREGEPVTGRMPSLPIPPAGRIAPSQLTRTGLGTLPTKRKFWTVAQTRFSQERRAAHHVERQGFQFYLPETVVPQRSGHERREILFPGYIFIQIDRLVNWAVLSSTRGISRLMTQGDQPIPMRDRDVEDIRRMEDSRGFVVLRSRFRNGEEIRVSSEDNSLLGLHGLYLEMTAPGRCRVLLTIMGRPVSADVMESELSAA